MSVTVKVRVPGTTANCGPGFDTLGIACSIYNELTLTLSERKELSIKVNGEGVDVIPHDETNIVVKAIQKVLQRVNQPYPGIRISMYNTIPLARGLGSSAAAIVAGLVSANAATGNTLSREEILDMATELEGHPDNVAPAIFGGVAVSMMKDGKPESLRFLPPAELSMVVAVPEFGLSTHLARQVLPESVPFADAVFNVSRSALLAVSLCQGDYRFLRYALDDRLHQPYRAKLVPGLSEVLTAAMDHGALGAALSGAGPCVMAFAKDDIPAIGDAMVQAFAARDIKAAYLSLNIDPEGAKIVPPS